MGFPGGSVVKHPLADAGDTSLIFGSGRSPGEGSGNHSRVLTWRVSIGQRSLAGYRPWGHKRVGFDLATKHQVHSRIKKDSLLYSRKRKREGFGIFSAYF